MTFLPLPSLKHKEKKKTKNTGLLTKQRQHGTQRASVNLNFIFYNAGEKKN